MIDLDEIFGYDDAASLTVADPPQPDAPATVDAVVGHHLEYCDDITTDDDLHDAAGVFDVALDDIDLWPGDDTADPAPCPECNGLELWESLAGEWKCCKCDPPIKAGKWLEKAARLRKRYGLPDPIGAA